MKHLFCLLLLLAHLGVAQSLTVPTQGGEVGVEDDSTTATSLHLVFGANGNGQGRVVAVALAPRNKPVPLSPTDGQFYTASPVFGRGSVMEAGFVVYAGTGHAVTVTGLQPNTRYYVTSCEYNTDGKETLYNTYGISLITGTLPATPLAVNEPTTQLVQVYPNPSAGHSVQLLLQGFAGEKLELRLFDAVGRVVLAQQLAPVGSRYDAPLALPGTLAAGCYILRIAGSGAPTQKRLVISE